MLSKTPKARDAKTASVPKSSNILLTFAVCAVVFGAGWLLPGNALRVGSRYFKYEVVDSPEEREKGLSGRDSLPAGQTMLFIFYHADKYCFWMKDMNFSIDIIWLDEAKKVVHTEQNVSPDTYPNSFCSSKDARYVVEVNAGTVQKTGLKTGDKISF